MASIIKEIRISAKAVDAWEAVRDVGALHVRLVPGFVTDTVLEGEARIVTFANGMVVRERIVDVDDTARRLAYSNVLEGAVHHAASVQVFEAEAPDECRLVWITDVLPHEIAAPIAEMMDAGLAAVERTLGARS
jgi:hypothetical protein